jgi:proteasome lid subunit RPN8/RPN11
MEWASFSAARKFPDPAARDLRLDEIVCRLEPCFDPELGPPYVARFRAVTALRNRSLELEIPTTYFRDLAQTASSQFVARGDLAPGEVFQYRICAYAALVRQVTEGLAPRSPFAVRPIAQALAVNQRSLDGYVEASLPHGSCGEDTFPVFIPRHVLREAADVMRAAGAKETGGILVGHLHRDAIQPELFAEVTAQVPAQYAVQELTRLAFTPDTWVAVDTAISLRQQNEIYLGWWHSHPSGEWCEACPPETRQRCKLSGRVPGSFFSTLDLALHRSVFPRAYSVALVLTQECRDGNGGPTAQLYGWHQGMMVARGFQVLGATDWLAPAAALLQHGA